MKLFMDRFQATLLHMRVDLRRRNIRMSQKFLNDPQISPVRQKMSGKRVPQKMRINVHFKSACGRDLF